MRGVMKIPIPQPPVTAPPIPAPTFDYIIDIYADKVVITDSYGNIVSTLNTISDLNNWLKNVREKKIRVNVNTVVTNDLILTQNEYWVYGDWIRGNVYLLERNIVIYSWASMSDGNINTFVTNFDPDTGTETDVSGLRLYAFVYANILIYYPDDILQNVIIYVANSEYTWISRINGDVYAQGVSVRLEGVTIRNAYIVALKELFLWGVQGNLGNWVMISYDFTDVGGVSLNNVVSVYLRLTHRQVVYVLANSSVTINLIDFGVSEFYYVKAIGLLKPAGDKIGIDPLPPGVTWSIDPGTAQLTITNNTSSNLEITVIYEVICDTPSEDTIVY